jgi:hypothetical protein
VGDLFRFCGFGTETGDLLLGCGFGLGCGLLGCGLSGGCGLVGLVDPLLVLGGCCGGLGVALLDEEDSGDADDDRSADGGEQGDRRLFLGGGLAGCFGCGFRGGRCGGVGLAAGCEAGFEASAGLAAGCGAGLGVSAGLAGACWTGLVG